MLRFKMIVCAAAVMSSLVAACEGSKDDFTDAEWKKIKALEPMAGAAPRNPYNTRDQDEVLGKLGQMLFFEKDVAEGITATGPSGLEKDIRKVGCVNCHSTKMFADATLASPGALGSNGGVPGLSHGRNFLATQSVAMVNLHWYEWNLSSGRFDSMIEHGGGVWGTSASVLAQARFVYLKYKDEWNLAFPDNQLDPKLGLPATEPGGYPMTGGPSTGAPGAFEMMPIENQNHIHKIRANLARLWDTYPRMLTTPDSPFQRYVRDNDDSDMTGAAKRGLRLFIGKAACNDCHNGPALTDNKFHNLGTPSTVQIASGTLVEPNRTTAVALNRGRATAVAAIVANLNVLDVNPDNPLNFSGAGKWSDDPILGRERLEKVRQQDAEHCICRSVPSIATAAACTDAVVNSATQKALRSVDSLECLKMDDSSACVCRKTDVVAMANIDACTPSAISASPQTLLRSDTTVACLKYDETLEGAFRTASLLNVAETAPYFHGGLHKTLDEVVWFYNAGGGPPGTFVGTKSPEMRPLGLTESEMQDLVEFMRSLTGKSPADVAIAAKQAAIDRGEDPNTVHDWSKNTAKPPLTGLGGAGGTTGAGGAAGAGGMAGAGGTTGAGGAGATGVGGAGAVGGATGLGGAGGSS
jgi:cytochrome c peroxidase